jgi:hypothetical protein
MGHSNWHIAKKNKSKELGRLLLIDRRGDYFPKFISMPLA